MAAADDQRSPLPAWLMPIAMLGVGALVSFIFTSSGRSERLDEIVKAHDRKLERIEATGVTGREVQTEFERLWRYQDQQQKEICEQRVKIAFLEGVRSATQAK